jgi:hypothetical protein
MDIREPDYLIIGGGPSGLFTAWMLIKNNPLLNITIVEKSKYLGGCHRAAYTKSGYFYEHSPRIYSNSYLNFIKLLSEMDINFYKLFTPYKFDVSETALQLINNFSWREIFLIGKEFTNLIAGPEYVPQISCHQMTVKNNFSQKAKDAIDNLCRLTDGAGSDRYTLIEFLQLINENISQKIYQPKHPTNQVLWKLVSQKLISRGVKIYTTTPVINITNNNVLVNFNKIRTKVIAKKYISTVPLYDLIPLLPNDLPQITKYKEIADKTKYNTYLPIIFHWNQKITLKSLQGMVSTSWGLIQLVSTDYTKFKNSKTVISCCISKVNQKSKVTNLSANETKNKNDLWRETFRQLLIHYPNLTKPNRVIVNATYLENEWKVTDNSFMTIPETINYHFPRVLTGLDDLYISGIHSNYHDSKINNLESAVVNSMKLVQELELDSNIHIDKVITLVDLIYLAFLIIAIIVIVLRNISMKT